VVGVLNTRAEVDEDTCVSSGKCVAMAPASFAFDDDEIAHAVNGAATLNRGQLITIGRTCPSGAIRVFEGDEPVDLDESQ
jgi:ferredoxin